MIENRGKFVKLFYTYIMSSPGGTLYTGVTNNLLNRVLTHKLKIQVCFTQKYNVTRLVFFEEFSCIKTAIAREKEIKGWKRKKKITLIESQNPKWLDLAEDWYLDDN
jgi:putative endonuclease